MKKLTLIIHTNAQQELADLLRTMDQVPGFAFSHVEGHGGEVENETSGAYLYFIPRYAGSACWTRWSTWS